MFKEILIVLALFALSGCCHGSWCVGAGGGKKEGVPPATNVDDRTGGVDPRAIPPSSK